MKKTGNRGLKVMFGIVKFVDSQAMNSGIILVVSFQRLHLVLEVRGCGRRKRGKTKWKEEELMQNLGKG